LFDDPSVDFALDVDRGETDGLPPAICQVGCEGNYTEIADAIDDLWDREEKEYEFFFTVNGDVAVGAGVIYDDFYDRVVALSESHPQVRRLILFYVPGSANDVIMTEGAKLVYDLKLSTCIPSDGSVASGGTDLFAAGYNRYATPGAEIGIHSWEGDDVVGSDVPRDDPEHDRFLDLYDHVCIPRDFYWETLSYGLPMHYISEEEIDSTFPYFRDCDNECNNKDLQGSSSNEKNAESDIEDGDGDDDGDSNDNTYYRYGNSIDVLEVHTQALEDWAKIIKETVGVILPGVSIFQYDPKTMTDDEVNELINEFCAATQMGSNCHSPADVRNGDVCGEGGNSVCNNNVLVFTIGTVCRNNDVACIQKLAVHEFTHIFQITSGSESHNRDGGDAAEDWRYTGPRWWREGTSTWIEPNAGKAYPDIFTQVDPEQNPVEACDSFQLIEDSHSIDLTYAIQKSDKKWESIMADDLYYESVYQGGYCAVEFLLRGYETTEDKIAGLFNVMKNAALLDSWELAFLTEFSDYNTMADFYTAFEGITVSENDACPPWPLDTSVSVGTCLEINNVTIDESLYQDDEEEEEEDDVIYEDVDDFFYEDGFHNDTFHNHSFYEDVDGFYEDNFHNDSSFEDDGFYYDDGYEDDDDEGVMLRRRWRDIP